MVTTPWSLQSTDSGRSAIFACDMMLTIMMMVTFVVVKMVIFDVDGWRCWSWWWTIKMDGHNIYGQKFQQVRNEENRFFAITSSKWVRNWFCKKDLLRNPIVMKFAISGLFSRASIDITLQFFDHNKVQTYPT